MTKEEIKALAEKRGLTLWATYSDDRLQFMDRHGINIIVTPETAFFEMIWMVPKSIFRIDCPYCSPFDNEEHFNKIYRKFKRTVWTCRDALEETEQ
jgi:hypothetical protein